jgi:hypothetical protein
VLHRHHVVGDLLVVVAARSARFAETTANASPM